MAELSWTDARQQARTAVCAAPHESISLAAGQNRTLADDVVARLPLPSFATAAMDGWVVRGGGPWRIVGTVDAGHPSAGPLHDGEAMRIATGAAVPTGDAHVIPWEVATVVEDRVEAAIPDKVHIRPVGEECQAGDLLARRGDQLNPALLGSLAAAGVDEVTVFEPTRVQVLILGDEVVQSGLPEHGQVRDALGIQLPGWIEALGGVVVGSATVSDDPQELATAVEWAVDVADVVVCTGGTSRGHRDFLREAIDTNNGMWLVDGVHVRPGHPMMLAKVGDVPVVGLPGNPLSALVGFVTLAMPLLETRMARGDRPLPRVQMAQAIPPARGDVTRVMVGRRELGGFREVPHVSSAMLRGIAHADGWAVIPASGVGAGDVVEWIPVPWDRRTSDD